MTAINNRYDFVYLFDVANGNPNGDPDAGNLPRLDPETNKGLVSDVCLKRKVRNYVTLTSGDTPGHEIYVAERAILNNQHGRAWNAVLPEAGASDRKKLPKEEEKARALTAWMCANFFDVRTFGAVMTTGVNCGQVRGPVQFAFARSIEPILPLEVSITRMAATTEADAESKGDIRTMGASISCHMVSTARMATYLPASLAMLKKAPASPRRIWNCFGRLLNRCLITTDRLRAARWLRDDWSCSSTTARLATRLHTACSSVSQSSVSTMARAMIRTSAARTACLQHGPIRTTRLMSTRIIFRTGSRSSTGSDL